jgi:hypothetical protein
MKPPAASGIAAASAAAVVGAVSPDPPGDHSSTPMALMNTC